MARGFDAPMPRMRCWSAPALIDTPKPLMLSGVGEPAALQAHGIRVKHALPAVGGDLCDPSGRLLGAGIDGPGARRPHQQPGRGGTVHEERFVRRRVHNRYPVSGPAAIADRCSGHAGPTPTMQITVQACRPLSRGSVALRSADPLDAPVIDPAYMTRPEDLALQIAGVRRGTAHRGGGAARPSPQRRAGARTHRDDGCASLTPHTKHRRLRLPPRGHLPDGTGRECRGERRIARAWAARPARGGRIRDASDHPGPSNAPTITIVGTWPSNERRLTLRSCHPGAGRRPTALGRGRVETICYCRVALSSVHFQVPHESICSGARSVTDCALPGTAGRLDPRGQHGSRR